MKPTLTFAIPNPVFWWRYAVNHIKARLPRRPSHNKCESCGADCGESLWGWCSIECLFKLVTRPTKTYPEPYNPENLPGPAWGYRYIGKDEPHIAGLDYIRQRGTGLWVPAGDPNHRIPNATYRRPINID